MTRGIQELAKGIQANTPIGVVRYPYLTQKDKGMNGEEGKYKVELFIKVDDLKGSDLGAKYKEVCTYFGDKSFKSPFMPVDEMTEDQRSKLPDELRTDGYVRIRPNSNFAVKVIGPDTSEMSEEEVKAKVLGGSLGRASVLIKPYTKGGNGIGLYLLGYQYYKKGEFEFGGVDGIASLGELEVPLEDASPEKGDALPKSFDDIL